MSDISDLFEEAEPPASKMDTSKPRWPHMEYAELAKKMAVINGQRMLKQKKQPPGIFVMQYNQFDIYVYPQTFMLRWGKDYYCKHHPYQTIKETLDGKWQLPEDVQAAILAARTLIMGDFT